MTRNDWHPRGETTWPDWKKAKEGQRFEHVRTGAQGTFIKVAKSKNNGAIVRWDGGSERSYVVAPAFDLRPIEEN